MTNGREDVLFGKEGDMPLGRTDQISCHLPVLARIDVSFEGALLR